MMLRYRSVEQQIKTAMSRSGYTCEQTRAAGWEFADDSRTQRIIIRYWPDQLYSVERVGSFLPLAIDLNLKQLLGLINNQL